MRAKLHAHGNPALGEVFPGSAARGSSSRTLASAAVWPATKTRMPLSPACIQWAMRSIASRARRVDREHAGESLRWRRTPVGHIAVSWP